jgi:hypothetical protein
LEEHSLAGQHARIGCDSDLPVGIECSGLVVTFRLGRSHNHLSLRAKENLSKFANRIRSLVTNSVTEESSNTPVEIAFPQKFLAASGGIHKSQGQIEIDASRKENLDLLRPVYRDIAAKHFASVRDLFANKLPRVWKSLVSLGVKVDPEPCHKEVHRMLENGATVEPEVEFATVEPEVEFATVELEVEFENCEDIDVVWQKLGLDSP